MIVAAGVAALVLLAGWVLYPALLALVGGARAVEPVGSAAPGDELPPITVVMATREAPGTVAARVANLLASDYPAGRLRVVIAVDAGASQPPAAYREVIATDAPVRVVPGDPAGGKAANLNAAMREVTTELVLFADSAQSWEPSAARRLVQALAPARVGGVTGAIATDAERGVFGAFWRYEGWLRILESRSGRVVAVTGAIHGLKRACWSELPPGLICDDLLIPLRAARQGYWVVAEPAARARDPRRFDRATQVQRKVRTLTGMLQVCAWQPWVLVPGLHRLWAPFLCHKLIRIATPFLVLVIALAVATALPAAWLAVGLAGLALVGLVVPALLGWPVRRLGEELFWAGRLLAAPVQALANALRGRWDVWHPHPR